MREIAVDISWNDALRRSEEIDDDFVRASILAAVSAVDIAGDPPPFPIPEAALRVSVRVTTDDEIRQLNRDYRAVDRSTDILSFSPFDDSAAGVVLFPGDEFPLGDIVISRDTAARQSAELGHSLQMEIAWLTVHGALQLLGYEHADDEEAAHMEALERDALQGLGFTVPS